MTKTRAAGEGIMLELRNSERRLGNVTRPPLFSYISLSFFMEIAGRFLFRSARWLDGKRQFSLSRVPYLMPIEVKGLTRARRRDADFSLRIKKCLS